MKKNILTVFLLCLICALSSSSRGMVYEVGPFDKLSQQGNINIVYRSVPDSLGMACYFSDTDYSGAFDVRMNNGKLSIKETKGHGFEELPTLYVYSDYLSEIKSEGLGVIEADLTATTPVMSVNLVGNGKIICEGLNSSKVSASITTGHGTIVLRGECGTAELKLTGTGLIQADELKADYVKCQCLGTGAIGCWPVEGLEARGIGSTKIYYKGSPSIKKIGGATLIQLVNE